MVSCFGGCFLNDALPLLLDVFGQVSDELQPIAQRSIATERPFS